MADYRTIADAEVDPDAPLTSSLGYAWRDNPIAIAEGATGAPRITQSAIMNPTAGNFRTITSVTGSLSSGSSTVRLVKFSVLTGGVIRVRTIVSDIPAGGPYPYATISRIRNGNRNEIALYNDNGTRIDDVNVQIGDMIIVELTTTEPRAITCNAQILIGNDAVAGVVVESNGI